jgi:hypothetical protein
MLLYCLSVPSQKKNILGAYLLVQYNENLTATKHKSKT